MWCAGRDIEAIAGTQFKAFARLGEIEADAAAGAVEHLVIRVLVGAIAVARAVRPPAGSKAAVTEQRFERSIVGRLWRRPGCDTNAGYQHPSLFGRVWVCGIAN